MTSTFQNRFPKKMILCSNPSKGSDWLKELYVKGSTISSVLGLKSTPTEQILEPLICLPWDSNVTTVTALHAQDVISLTTSTEETQNTSQHKKQKSRLLPKKVTRRAQKFIQPARQQGKKALANSKSK